MSFKIGSRFVKAASLVNALPVEKFPLLLSRILSKLHLKEAFFNAQETEQLQDLFSLSAEQLSTVLDCISYIFEQAAFTSTGPEDLFSLLEDSTFSQPHAKAICRAWGSAGEYLAHLKQQSLGPPTLLGVDYHLNMVLGQAALGRQQEPTALFEFDIGGEASMGEDTSTNTGVGTGAGAGAGAGAGNTPISTGTGPDMSLGGGDMGDKLLLEFDHEELFSFFAQLERVQLQLDALGGAT